MPQTTGPAAEPPAQQSAGPQTRKVAGVQDAEGIAVRLRDARSLPELLAVSFDAFEVIRVLARGSEDLTPSLFAACQAQYPAITLADITTRDAMMVARKD